LKGGLEPLEDGVAGRGVPVWGYSAPSVSLGTAPGSRRRAVSWITLPRAEGRVEAAYLSVGVLIERGERFPVSWKMSVDGVSISREFKPQFTVDTDYGVYGRAIYDVKPVLARRLAEREDHKIFMARDAYRPIRVVDVFFYARYQLEGASYEASYHTGAAALEPGESVSVYANLGRSIGGGRKAAVTVYSPSHQARLRVVAGGSQPVEVAGLGGYLAEVRVPYKGSPVPVSVVYETPREPFYPKTAIVSDVVVAEVLAPEPKPRVAVESVERSGSRLRIRLRIENEGEGQLSNALLVAIALGTQLARSRIERLEPGGAREVEVTVDTSRIPVSVRRVQLRLVWRHLGAPRNLIVDVEAPP